MCCIYPVCFWSAVVTLQRSPCGYFCFISSAICKSNCTATWALQKLTVERLQLKFYQSHWLCLYVWVFTFILAGATSDRRGHRAISVRWSGRCDWSVTERAPNRFPSGFRTERTANTSNFTAHTLHISTPRSTTVNISNVREFRHESLATTSCCPSQR